MDNSYFKLKQMKCPSCGQNITQFKPFSPTVTCPYCHEKSLNPFVSEKNIEYPELIIKCTKTEEDFSEYLLEHLLDGELVPKDIFKTMELNKLIKIYLPFYYYQGAYKCSWSCEIGHEEEFYNDRQNRTEKRISWEPKYGKFEENFEEFCLAVDDTTLPEELTDYTDHLFAGLYSYHLEQFDDDFFTIQNDDFLTAEKNITKEKGWELCRYHINRTAERSAKRMIPSPKRNIHISTNAEYNSSKYAFIPFWFLYYTYEGKKYFCIMDGTGEGGKVSIPDGDFIKKQIQKIYKVYLCVGLIFALLTFLSGNIIYALIAIADWVGYKVHKKSIVNNYKKDRLLEAEKIFPDSKIIKKKILELNQTQNN